MTATLSVEEEGIKGYLISRKIKGMVWGFLLYRRQVKGMERNQVRTATGWCFHSLWVSALHTGEKLILLVTFWKVKVTWKFGLLPKCMIIANLKINYRALSCWHQEQVALRKGERLSLKDAKVFGGLSLSPSILGSQLSSALCHCPWQQYVWNEKCSRQTQRGCLLDSKPRQG